MQYINENSEYPFHGLNLQEYLYYNNKMKNEKINKLVLDKVASYELTQPRKEKNQRNLKIQEKLQKKQALH